MVGKGWKRYGIRLPATSSLPFDQRMQSILQFDCAEIVAFDSQDRRKASTDVTTAEEIFVLRNWVILVALVFGNCHDLVKEPLAGKVLWRAAPAARTGE